MLRFIDFVVLLFTVLALAIVLTFTAKDCLSADKELCDIKDAAEGVFELIGDDE